MVGDLEFDLDLTDLATGDVSTNLLTVPVVHTAVVVV